MATIQVVGQRAANTAFNPSLQQAQAQVPAINNLYATLLQGLQNQSGSQLQNVLTSADQRGVMRGSQEASTQQALNSTLMQSGAQLGAQRAQNVAGVQGVVGQGQAQRALSAQQLVEGLTAADLAKKENQLKLTEINRANEINTVRNQVAEAKAAARASRAVANNGEKELASRIDSAMLQMVGGDKKVSPETYKQALSVWTGQGLSPDEFHTKFDKYVNFSHVQDYYR